MFRTEASGPDGSDARLVLEDGAVQYRRARRSAGAICRSRFTGVAGVAACGMAFKLTYSDGQATDYDDSTKWEVENGVVKMGREAGKWTVFVSPSHWATLELETGEDRQRRRRQRTTKTTKTVQRRQRRLTVGPISG